MSEETPHQTGRTRTLLAARRDEFLFALMLLTRLPAPVVIDIPPGLPARAAVFYGLVGTLVGLVGGGVFVAAGWIGLPPALGAGLALLALVMISGALHEDGLSDTADGIGGGRDRAHRLEIMRDSRIGSYGAIAVVFSLLLRWACLTTIATPATAAAAIVAASTLSRGLLPTGFVLLPSAREQGLAQSQGRPDAARAALAIVLAATIAALALGPATGLIALAAGIAGAGIVAIIACRALGGHTGDALGAAQQIAEIAILIALTGWLT